MRDCANCFHRKPVLKEDGTWTAECEKWDCEFQSRENMVEPIRCKDCKHTVLSKNGKTLICCLTMKVGTVNPNFYCGNGETEGGAK